MHVIDVLNDGTQEFDSGVLNHDKAETTWHQVSRSLKAEERFRDGQERTLRWIDNGEIHREITFRNGEALHALIV